MIHKTGTLSVDPFDFRFGLGPWLVRGYSIVGNLNVDISTAVCVVRVGVIEFILKVVVVQFARVRVCKVAA